MNYWIFQGKPSRYDVEIELIVGKVVEWTAYQNSSAMEIGDIVFLWRAAEKERAKRGIYGWGRIVKRPILDEESGYWVAVKYECKFPKFIPYEKLKTNKDFSTHQLFTFAIGTNFKVTETQYKGLCKIIDMYLGEGYLPNGEVYNAE